MLSETLATALQWFLCQQFCCRDCVHRAWTGTQRACSCMVWRNRHSVWVKLLPPAVPDSGAMNASAGKDAAATATTPSHGDAIKMHKAKVSLLSRELANLSQERDLLLDFVLGGSGASSLPPQELIHQLFSGRQAHLCTSQTMTSSLPTSLGVIPPLWPLVRRCSGFLLSSAPRGALQVGGGSVAGQIQVQRLCDQTTRIIADSSPTRKRGPLSMRQRPQFDAKPTAREMTQAITKTHDRSLKHTTTFGRLARGMLCPRCCAVRRACALVACSHQ